ncbi:hypothetical protein CC1G_10225 [Coprinopsis cinerea okayama7|uniref:Uncharacterized protein n=1 Tax=Coprinopsis cinerea (strain Okayama-7 / 130 / ATCC MYA-4618 / FGSC 9003) TaxID=240176 RepID=A8NPA9_COPC7|nr:hypothetical protein CC1G_10225 [Coprinopsis cinerea okayama7\|eukprot:XP_001835298.2 hypothetical protein CC1G_10225 [Coprinopsis cinerea okayama7\
MNHHQPFRLNYTLPKALSLSLLYGRYCQHVYHRLHDPRHQIPIFADIPIAIKSELHQLTSVIYQATRSEFTVHLEVRRIEPTFLPLSAYQTRNTRGPGLVRFPRGSDHHKIAVGPCFYVDSEGHPVAYHLPSAIQQHRLDLLNIYVEQSANRDKESLNPNSPFVRVDETCASPQATGYTHEKLGNGYTRLALAQLIDEQRGLFSPSPPLLESRYRGMRLLDNISETMAIIGAAMSIIHPPSFFAGFQILENLSKQPKAVLPQYIFNDALSLWTMPQSLLRIYTNYDSGVRREDVTPPLAFDTILSAGTSQENRFVCPNIGHEFYFHPGAGYDPHIVAIASFDEAVVRHATPEDTTVFNRKWSPADYMTLSRELRLHLDHLDRNS